jgi:PAT family beta-lactamase induction signal transducer AmpG
VVAPFADFARRPDWLAILGFVTLYNLGDATAGHMAGSLYVRLGFDNGEIASVSKVFGVIASLVGVALGGAVVYRLGVVRALFVFGVLKLVSNLMYVALDLAGHDVPMLALSIGTENVAGGLAAAAFVAYLSRLCSPAYTATQYALLSALAAVARTVLSSAGGSIAEAYGWIPFFLGATALGLPGLALLAWLARRGTILGTRNG